MKKLLIAMTAAAIGTCAWAEGEAGGDPEPTTPTVTYLDESFSENWTLANNAFWSYTGTEETELAITNVAAADAAADYALALNTGSKVLTGAFKSDGSSKDIGDGLYFKSTVTFKDPSDTLPTLGEQDKFALVVLDNIESVGATTDTNTTNLWVIAKYGADNGVTRAFKLNIPVSNTETLQDLDAAWLADDHEIEIKAYANVMASTPARAGFLVMVDGHVCSVDYAAPIVNGVIDFTAAGLVYGESTYLGFEPTDIAAAYRQRYVGVDNAKRQLLLSVVDSNANLTSVDFQGQGIIDNVALKDAPTGNFGEDSSAIEITAGPGVTLTGECAEGTLFYSGSSATVTFTLTKGYALASEKVVYDDDKTYSVTINPADYADGYTIASYWPKVSIDGNVYGSLAEAIEEADARATISLREAVVVTDAIDVSADITIDLNGKKISAVLTENLEAMFALGDGVTLTITDNATGGVLEVTGGNRTIASAPLRQKAVVAIDAGTIDAAVVTGELLEYNITGGKFLATANKGGVTVSNAHKTVVEGDYLKVVAKETFGLTVNKHNSVTITDANGNGLSFNDSYLEGTMLSFKVSYDTSAYQNLSVKVNGNDCSVTDGVYSFTVAAITVLDIQVTAISTGPTIDDTEGDITVDQNTGNATIETTNATVTVTGTVTGDVIVTPSVGTVNVTLAQGKEVKVYFEGKNITGAFTVSSANGTTTIVLNEEGEVDGVPVKPAMAEKTALPEGMTAPFEAGTDVAVGVKTIPGLKYQLIRSDAPNGTFGDVDGASATGTGAPVKLEDKNKPSGKGFYKVKVSQR